jgi:2-keto-4-pentenoate hydratase/2-oxohepta-3-ene-1,7-dioic acid hydratase in catechol pathway
MKLFRYGPKGHEKPGVVLSDGRHVDVSAFTRDYDEEFLGTNGATGLEKWLRQNLDSCLDVPPNFRYGACVPRPSKIICIGLNYSRHAAESGMERPKEPVIFLKAPSALCGPNDDVVIPKGSHKTDWEVEFAVVVGEPASYVQVEHALNHVFGYCLHNDYSEREFQLERGGQWVKGKSADTFAPLGPYLVTADEIQDPHRLHLWLKVNGETRQEANTSDLIFGVPHLVSYVSQFMTLLPGDVISTGTPSGVGLGFRPPRYLRPGDVVELGIDGLGSSRQQLVSYEEWASAKSLITPQDRFVGTN